MKAQNEKGEATDTRQQTGNSPKHATDKTERSQPSASDNSSTRSTEMQKEGLDDMDKTDEGTVFNKK